MYIYSYTPSPDGYGLDLKCPSKSHVLKAWSPMKQCSEMDFWKDHGGSDLTNGLIH
jgi:hypothetical protein